MAIKAKEGCGRVEGECLSSNGTSSNGRANFKVNRTVS